MTIIVDATSGTILDLSNCYIVFEDSLTESEEHALDNGSDSEIAEVGRQSGISIQDSLEWIVYGRLTSVSYGPSALRNEAKVMLEDATDETRGWLEWAINDATDADLVWLAQYILEGDQAWEGFRENVVDALRWRAENPEPF